MSGTLQPGTVIDQRYTLERRLGSGSTGVVWLAKDTQRDQAVALKILHPKMSHDQVLVAQLAREARILAQLEHPHIAQCFELVTEGDFVYLVMEVVAGQPLSEELGEHSRASLPFKIGEVSAIFGPLCRAVAHAHERGIVHRDLKPQNVMLTSRSPIGIKVLDFGIARLLEGNPFDATTMGRQLGSLFYMSPEQTRGEPADAKSDVFALGAMAFELLTLRRAWVWDEAEQPVAAFAQPIPASPINAMGTVMARIGHAERPRPTQFRADLPLMIDEVVMRAMAIAPGDRYPGPLPFLEALQDSLQSVTAKDDPLTTVLPEVPKEALRGWTGSALDQAMTQAMESPAAALAPKLTGLGTTGPIPASNLTFELVDPGPTVRDSTPLLPTRDQPAAPSPTPTPAPAQPKARAPARTLSLARGLTLAAMAGSTLAIGLLLWLPAREIEAPLALKAPQVAELELLLSRGKAGDPAAISALWARIEAEAAHSDDPELRRRLGIYLRFRGTSREVEGLEGGVRVLADAAR